MTVSCPTPERINAWPALPKDRIDRPAPEVLVEELLEKVPHYKKTYLENGMTPAEFARSIPFCRAIHEFLAMYKDAIRTIRGVIIPDLYGNETPTDY